MVAKCISSGKRDREMQVYQTPEKEISSGLG